MGGLALARACGVPFVTSFSFFSKLSKSGMHRLGAVVGVQPLSLAPKRSPSFLCSFSESPSSLIQQTTPMPTVFGPKISFCPACGGATEHRIPTGEEKPRAICTSCGIVHYQNPKMVVGCLVIHEDKILLCRRSIEPSYGLWTLPAGYMELGESAVEGAVRETWEEANAEVEVEAPFAQLDIPRIGQSYILFRAKLKTTKFSPGVESLECALFSLDEIPFDRIAFSSVSVALKLYVEDVRLGRMKVHHGVIEKRAGASPSDPSGYAVRDHLSV